MNESERSGQASSGVTTTRSEEMSAPACSGASPTGSPDQHVFGRTSGTDTRKRPENRPVSRASSVPSAILAPLMAPSAICPGPAAPGLSSRAPTAAGASCAVPTDDGPSLFAVTEPSRSFGFVTAPLASARSPTDPRGVWRSSLTALRDRSRSCTVRFLMSDERTSLAACAGPPRATNSATIEITSAADGRRMRNEGTDKGQGPG